MKDTLYRADMRPGASQKPKTVTRVRWMILRGAIEDAGTPASHRLYTAAQAKRFVRLATRFGLDVYAARFGRADIHRPQPQETAP